MKSEVYHLLPSLSIGGAECLVLNSVVKINKKRKYYIVFFDSIDFLLWNQLSSEQKKNIIIIKGRLKIIRYFKCIIFLYKIRDSIIITSLWRSVLLVYIFSFFVKLKRHVAFIHRSKMAHPIDGFLRKWQINNSIIQLADSLPAKIWVQKNTSHPNVIQIPLLFKVDFIPVPKKMAKINFCFVGRLSKVKNINRILELMLILHNKIPHSIFDFYGPDQGELPIIQKFIKKNKLENAVSYKGVVMPWELKLKLINYHYIISLSHTEGMAMSIAEAMQLGIVPIVGNVGGPSEYCVHLVNAIKVFDYSDISLEKIAELVKFNSQDEIAYNQMAKSAHLTFLSYKYYEECFEKELAKISDSKFC